MKIISLKSVGLLTVQDAAALRGWSVRTVQRWIEDGKLPVIAAGAGRRVVYLLRIKDVKAFIEPKRGRPWPGRD